MTRESMAFDVVIIGGGPSGLSAAIRLKQLAAKKKKEISVCLLEKGSQIGAHLISGAVFEPRALNELIPDWKKKKAPLRVPVKEDDFHLLTENKAFYFPIPPQMKNEGNFIISLSEFARWLAGEAEALGVEIYPGFAAAEILYNEEGAVYGVATGDVGLDKKAEKTARFAEGMELHGKQIMFAEGCRGSLTKQLIQKFDLAAESDPQTYGLGIKEVWEIDPKLHEEGKVLHSVGWPLDHATYGGAWLYHWDKNRISIGYVVGLDYKNPTLSPFEVFQKFKSHPTIKPLLEGAKRIEYGARALSEGGLQSMPKLTFPGGVLIGDTAGFLNVVKIKGNHTAMKSGMLAAEAVFEHLTQKKSVGLEAVSYTEKFQGSWLYEELHLARNIRPSFHYGLWPGLLYSAFDTYILKGRAPWTFKNRADHTQLQWKEDVKAIHYKKPNGKISFDRLSSIFLSAVNHEENQPCHLKLKDEMIPVMKGLARFGSPEQLYCPAGVYEILFDENQMNPKLQINAQNCIHCKTCDIKDPFQNINWVTPEGGGGPNYTSM